MDYAFLRNAYSGQGGFADGSYLVRHPRESDEKYTRRKEIAWYPNYVRKVVNSFLGHVFRRGPDRDMGDNPLYTLFCNNVDRGGGYIDRFFRNAFRLALLNGTVFIVVDKPQEAAANRQDEIERRLYPYLALRLPEALQSWQRGDDGQLSKITLAESRTGADGKPHTVYRTWNRISWSLSKDAKGNDVIEWGEHHLGLVPIVFLHCDAPLTASTLLSVPWVFDLAKANKALFNRVSEHDDLLRSQTFSIFTLPARDREEAQGFSNMKISTENAVVYNPDGGGKPGFVAPADGPAESYLAATQQIVQTIYRMANLEFAGGGTAASSESKSGVALAFHFQEAGRLLAEFAAQIEAADYRVAEIVHLWMGVPYNGSISYPRTFDLVDLAAELSNALDAITMSISPTFERELKKKVSRNMLGEGISDDILARIDDEIDSAEADPYQADRVSSELEES